MTQGGVIMDLAGHIEKGICGLTSLAVATEVSQAESALRHADGHAGTVLPAYCLKSDYSGSI
jgi:hypothetical protein